MAGLGINCSTQIADIAFWCASDQILDPNPTDQSTALALSNLQQSEPINQLISKIQSGASQNQLNNRLTYLHHEETFNQLLQNSNRTQQQRLFDNCHDATTLSDLGTSHRGNIPDQVFIAILRDRLRLSISPYDARIDTTTKCTVCNQLLDSEGLHADTCSRSTNYKKDHQALAISLYNCAKSAAAQPNSRIENIRWDPVGEVNGDQMRPADIKATINHEEFAFDVSILHNKNHPTVWNR